MTDRTAPGWDEEVARVIEALIPAVRNGPQRKNLSAMRQVWADHDVVDIALDHRQVIPGI
jgi:hypothetical protein